MVSAKSLDPYVEIIASLLSDVQTLHSEVLTKRAIRLTTAKVRKRCAREGLGFLTKTLPRLGKALDRALSGEVSFDSTKLGFATLPCSKLPRFLGELFGRVFSHDGLVLPTPCANSVKSLRQILFMFYKLELPYDSVSEQKVLDQFTKTDKELECWNATFEKILNVCYNEDPLLGPILPPAYLFHNKYGGLMNDRAATLIRNARELLAQLFCNFDPYDIHPKHGPGAVSTKEKLSEKYTWTNISDRILRSYPLDAYFFASNGHVCDELVGSKPIGNKENSARVILVPKDSRGPRLISCEPLEFQWIQQGLGQAIVQLVEKHCLTRHSIHFTDQSPNRCGAALGSITGGYATLDLKEASDRVSIGLVRLLFPERLSEILMNCRTQSTVMPGGEVIRLNKFAPMGSALCFPILALTIWALLAAGLPDTVLASKRKRNSKSAYDARESILVYGDDVIVPTAQAANAIHILESFGLLVNRDKSCASGFFRESCGKDAFRGVDVTPVRIRTVWTNSRRPDAYVSYIAYANALYKQKYYETYELIVSLLTKMYGEIPEVSMNLSCPSLIAVPEEHKPKRRRTNSDLQKLEWYVWDTKVPKVRREIGGWKMLLRYFAEATDQTPLDTLESYLADAGPDEPIPMGESFSVSLYTKRKTSCLVKRWR